MQIDHLIYAAPDLDAAVADLDERFGVHAAGGGQHLGQGTHNTLLGLGGSAYLELVAPDPRQPEPDAPRPYGVDGVTRPGLVGWAVACPGIEDAVARARERGFDPGGVIDGRRVTVDGELLRWRLTRNALTAGVVPFLIDWGDTSHPAASAPVGLVLASLHVESPDATTVRRALDALDADVEVRPADRPALVARLRGPHGEAELR